jgi:hypothetical protein
MKAPCYVCLEKTDTSAHDVGKVVLCLRCRPKPAPVAAPKLPKPRQPLGEGDDAPTQPGGAFTEFKQFKTLHHVAEVRPGTGFSYEWGPKP